MRARAAAALVALLAAGCGGSGELAPRAAPTAAPPERTATAAPARAVPTPVPRLRGAAACRDVADATCSTLRVPLDRSGGESGTLELRVAVAGDGKQPVLVLLTGGPGEPGLPFMKRTREWLEAAADTVRLVVFDQRGTGADALDCPALQRAMGASDLTPPPAAAVRECAQRIGPRRRFYTTADTVEDLEALRQALHVPKLALDGISYGTYVAQHYALAHPNRVSALILDSVVPAEGVSLLSTTPIQATERVLGEDTTRELATVVREHHNGPELLDILTGLSVGAPRGNGAANAIHAAADGNEAPLDGLIDGVQHAMKWPAKLLSQGLHASTLCADMPAPWGDASAPLEGRREALEQAAAKLSDDDLYPYDRETATGNGIAQQCLNWPPVDVPPPAGAQDLPPVPTLLLAGDRDLSTPMEWAKSAARHAPRGRLIVVHDNGHDVQAQGDPEPLGAVRRLVASLE
ncbi:MAG TPA: alpha/beta fold hydrolase [Solirubrobacter sp.]|nr:alpha/beta fold hydrolase [Solirubrobacter sp.]